MFNIFIMYNHSRILLIQDVRSFCDTCINLCTNGAMTSYVTNPADCIEYFIDWSIDQLLTESFDVKVVGHYRNDQFKCILDENKQRLLATLMATVNTKEFMMLKGSEVKTMVVGYDLFITPKIIYRQYV